MPKISFGVAMIAGIKRYQVVFEPAIPSLDGTTPPIHGIENIDFGDALSRTMRELLPRHNPRDRDVEIYMDCMGKDESVAVRKEFDKYSKATRVAVSYVVTP